MRRTLLSILIGLCLHWPAYAQDPNPQTSFATTVLYANPSLYLNFNDQTTAFKEQISGLSFSSHQMSLYRPPSILRNRLVGGRSMKAAELLQSTIQAQRTMEHGTAVLVVRAAIIT